MKAKSCIRLLLKLLLFNSVEGLNKETLWTWKYFYEKAKKPWKHWKGKPNIRQKNEGQVNCVSNLCVPLNIPPLNHIEKGRM